MPSRLRTVMCIIEVSPYPGVDALGYCRLVPFLPSPFLGVLAGESSMPDNVITVSLYPSFDCDPGGHPARLSIHACIKVQA